MSRKFITEREIAFIDSISKELIQNVSEQTVYYYAIDMELTPSHNIYDEAIQKVWKPPVQLTARVSYDNPSVSSTQQTLDSKYKVEVYFHKKELQDRNLDPREGDFIEFGAIVYEITSVTQPQLVYGQHNNKLMIKCMCMPSREGQFAIGGSSEQNISNTHAIENTSGIPPTNSISTDATYAVDSLASGAYGFPMVYYGVSATGSYTSSFITGLTSSARHQGRTNIGNLSLNIVTAQYGFIALPTSFAAAASSFIDDETGFDASFTRVATSVSVDDSILGITPYDVWKSNRAGLGAIVVRMV